MTEYTGKKVLVCGMARSGISAAKMLKRLGAEVVVQDIKTGESAGETVRNLRELGVELYLGREPDGILERFDMVVVSPGIPCDLPFFDRARELGVPVVGEVELAYTVCGNKIAAITGTNGKTTTTALVYEILAGKFEGSEVVGNIGVPFSERVLDMKDGAYLAAEISSFQLETVREFKPHIAAMLNVTPDHLNRHYSMENYAAVKERIFHNQGGGDFAVINYDDLICRKMADRARAKVVFFSRKERVRNGVYADGDTVYFNWDYEDTAVLKLAQIKMPGAHNVENVLAAVAIGICAGVPVGGISEAVSKFKGAEHRIEFVGEKDGIVFYNDSKATNVDSAVKAIEAMNRPILLIGGGKDKAADFEEWVKLFPGRVKFLAAIGETKRQISDTCRANGFFECYEVETLKEAVGACFKRAASGDCILLSPACASLDMFENFEQRGRMFKEYAGEIIGGRSYAQN